MTASLSPSRANDFMQCPLLYRLRAVDRLPEPQSAAAARGTLVHAVLERVFDLPAIERTPERAVAMLPQEWERLVAEHPERAELVAEGEAASWHETAAALVRAWFTLENPQRLEPAGREQLLTAAGPGVDLKGFIDRLDVAPTGEVRIVDYKTGKAPKPAYVDKALFQMRFYALMYRTLTGVLATQLQIVYLGSGEVIRHQPTDAELDRVQDKVAAVWSAIQEALAARSFEPRPSRLCDWCHHQPVCPAFGGTPPPFPEPEGLAEPGSEHSVEDATGVEASAEEAEQVAGPQPVEGGPQDEAGARLEG